jgi:hypothetical protein
VATWDVALALGRSVDTGASARAAFGAASASAMPTTMSSLDTRVLHRPEHANA